MSPTAPSQKQHCQILANDSLRSRLDWPAMCFTFDAAPIVRNVAASVAGDACCSPATFTACFGALIRNWSSCREPGLVIER